MTTNHDQGPSALDFDALLASVTMADDAERRRLRTLADQCDIAHTAYSLGIDYLQQEKYAEALTRLRIAVRHGLDDVLPLVQHCELLVTIDNAREPTTSAVAAEAPRGPMTDLGENPSMPRQAAPEDTVRATVMPGRIEAAAGGAAETTVGGAAGATVLRASHGSLAYGTALSVPGAISALTLTGGLALGPGEGRRILFGRNRPEVDICIGEDDRHVGRHQGTLEHRAGHWRVRNTGRLPLRIGHRLLFPDEDALVLGDGFTQLFLRGRNREHLLEVFVTGPDGHPPTPMHAEPTAPPRQWQLSDTEKLVLVVLAQRYLLGQAFPRPVTLRQAAEELAELQPEANWTAKRVEHAVAAVRGRLARSSVRGLTREEVSEPVGNGLNHNLIKELLMSASLVPRDLRLADII